MSKKNESICKFFFSRCPDNACFYYCRNEKCKAKPGRPAKRYKQVPGTGWTNLINHLRSCVGPNYETIYNDHVTKAPGNIDGFFYGSPRDSDAYQLIEWVIMRNQPLSEVDNELTRAILKCKPMSSKSLRKYILAMIPVVERRIHDEIPDKFGLLFDGWSDGTVHYVAIFAIYNRNGEYTEMLLACGPLDKEDDLSADQHVQFLHTTLEFYNKNIKDVVALVSDNCAVNRKISNLTNIPLIGCASHKFNLAVELWISTYDGLPDAL